MVETPYADVRQIAQVLASPDRSCPATRTHVPRDCLQSFKLMAHPESGDPWWVPPDLSAACAAQSLELVQRPPTGPIEQTAPTPVARGPTVYTLARKDFLRSFTDASGKYRNGFRSFLRVADSPGLTGTLNKAIWRKDMDSHILELMRRRVFEGLVHLSSLCETRDRHYLTSLESPDQLSNFHQLGCVFLLGETPVQGEHRGSQQPILSLGKLPTGFTVPVYGISDLLGDTYVARLQLVSPKFQGTAMVLLRGQRTVALQKRLWKLYSYI